MLLTWILLLGLSQVSDFHEDFSFGFTHAWRIFDPKPTRGGSSSWFVKDGVLHQSIGTSAGGELGKRLAGSRFLLTEPSFEDGTLFARIASQDDGLIALLFRVQDENHYYRFSLLDDESKGGPFMRLERWRSGEVAVLAEKKGPIPYPFGLWWILAVDLRGGTFEASINGEPVLQGSDDAFSRGGIGVSCSGNNGVRVDSSFFLKEHASKSLLTPKPALLKGPCVWCLAPDRFTLTWETSLPFPSTVEIIQGGKTRTIDGEAGSALFHALTVRALEPGSIYRYRVVSGPVISPVYTVKTPPENMDQFRFCAYGDNRSNPDSHRIVVKSMLSKRPDFVLNMGDVVTNGLKYEQWLPEFFGPAEWLMHSVPYYLCIGNHERDSVWIDRLLALPGNKRYYAFTQGTAYFIALDSNRPLGQGSPQLAWLKAALRSDAAKKARWRFAFFHHPPYSQRRMGPGTPPAIRELVLPLFEEAGFDILFFRPDHHYERGLLNGVHHIVTGGGGAPLSFGRHDKARAADHITVNRCLYHACLIEVNGDRLSFSAFSPDGKVFDAFEIIK